MNNAFWFPDFKKGEIPFCFYCEESAICYYKPNNPLCRKHFIKLSGIDEKDLDDILSDIKKLQDSARMARKFKDN